MLTTQEKIELLQAKKKMIELQTKEQIEKINTELNKINNNQ